TVSFGASPPPFEAIASHVEDRGGLPIGSRMENSALRLHFLCFPKDEIELHKESNGGSQVLVIDRSLQGGALYQLVCQALVELGGACAVEWVKPLRLPLTVERLRRERLYVAAASTLVAVILALVAIGVLSGVAFLVWKMLP